MQSEEATFLDFCKTNGMQSSLNYPYSPLSLQVMLSLTCPVVREVVSSTPAGPTLRVFKRIKRRCCHPCDDFLISRVGSFRRICSSSGGACISCIKSIDFVQASVSARENKLILSQSEKINLFSLGFDHFLRKQCQWVADTTKFEGFSFSSAIWNK